MNFRAFTTIFGRTSRGQFHQRSAFMFVDHESAKKTVKLSVFLHSQDLRRQKLCIICWWNWPLIYQLAKHFLFQKYFCFKSNGLSFIYLLYTLICKPDHWWGQWNRGELMVRMVKNPMMSSRGQVLPAGSHPLLSSKLDWKKMTEFKKY